MSANVVSKSGIHTGSGSASVIVSGENTLLLLMSYGIHFDYVASATWSLDSGSFEYVSSAGGAEFWWLKSPAGGIGNVTVVCDEEYENIHWCILSLNNIEQVDTLRTYNSVNISNGMGLVSKEYSPAQEDVWSSSTTSSGLNIGNPGILESSGNTYLKTVKNLKSNQSTVTCTLAVTDGLGNCDLTIYHRDYLGNYKHTTTGYGTNLQAVYSNFDAGDKVFCTTWDPEATREVTFSVISIFVNPGPHEIVLDPTENQDFCVAILGSDTTRVIFPLETGITEDSYSGFEYGNAVPPSKTMGFSLTGTNGYVLVGIALKTILTTLFTYILQRVGDTFLYVDKASLPQRLECSLSYPLLSVEDNIISLDIIDTYNLSVYPQNGIISLGEVGDFKYTRVASGVALENKLLVSLSGTVQTADISNISSPLYLDSFSTIFTTESGENTHAIETSNYLSESQYIFVATSGDNPKFYQQDDEPFREESLSLGSSPVITIRLDDRI